MSQESPSFRRSAYLATLLLSLSFSLLGQRRPYVVDGPSGIKSDFDAFSQAPVRTALPQVPSTLVMPGTRVQMEERLGVPTFLWAAAQAKPAQPLTSVKGQGPEETAARQFLANYASVYQQSAGDVKSATLLLVHNIGRGPVIVRFGRSIDGVEVFREEVSVAMTQQLELISISGFVLGTGSTPANRSFSLPSTQALARAIGDLIDITVDPNVLQRVRTQGPYDVFDFGGLNLAAAAPFRFVDSPRAKKVYFRLADHLEAAYYVEVNLSRNGQNDPLAFSYVIAAGDGRVLFSHNQTAQDGATFSYRVWADTSGLFLPMDSPFGLATDPASSAAPGVPAPPFVLPNLVTLQNGPISTNDPWLPAGATFTKGNNVEAFADLSSPDNYQANSNDTYAYTNGPNTFDRTYDTSLGPQVGVDQIQAAVTQLFYNVNFFHDWYYDSGFKEVDGNAQTSNYGRGGLENDSIFAEAQDFAGRNNANMSTPSDGGRPRMRMYVFDGPSVSNLSATGAVTGTFNHGTAAFGPSTFNVPDTPVSLTTPLDGCTAISTVLTGKVAFIDRGTCNFDLKVKNAQNAGAAAVIIANVSTSSNPSVPPNMAAGSPPQTGIVIGTLSLNYDDGNLFRAALGASQAVNATLSRSTGADRDGDLDNQIVAHEWGHYISNRLVHNSAGLTTNMAGGLGEGWGDFHAMLLTVRQSTDAAPSYTGVYPLAAYSTDDYYFGIRRVPYSINFSNDPLTFQDIANGVPLPAGVPYLFGADGSTNSEVHNTGEIWATMLWECYASLLRDTQGANPRLTFDQARDRMKDYIVAAYKLTPVAPTLLEARDALLTAAYATDKGDFQSFWRAFARRGAGINAVAPDRFSTTNTPGLVESYEVGGAFHITGIAVTDSVVTCDADGMLDSGETGKLTVTIENVGSQLLHATTATVTVNNPNVSFPAGNVINFSATKPFTAASASILVSLKGATGIQQLDFAITATDPALNPGGNVVGSLSVYANADTALNASAGDDVEAPISAWSTAIAAGANPWARALVSTTPLNYVWHAPDVGGDPTDRSLITPALAVGSGAFSFTFSHRFSFETDGTNYYDGGVIELSADGGTTWTDIGSGYNHTIFGTSGNPLANRSAYTGASAGYPSFVPVTISLGTTYAGNSVIIRFRMGEDAGGGGAGWDVDNLVFTGLNNTPFTALVADEGCERRTH